jgi:hypothetical protein
LRIIVDIKLKIIVALTEIELNFDEFNSGGLHEKRAIATWNLGTIHA